MNITTMANGGGDGGLSALGDQFSPGEHPELAAAQAEVAKMLPQPGANAMLQSMLNQPGLFDRMEAEAQTAQSSASEAELRAKLAHIMTAALKQTD